MSGTCRNGPRPTEQTHVLTPGAALDDVAETVHVAGECDECRELEIDADGHVSRGDHYYGRVRRTRWSHGRTWEALDPDGRPISIPGRNMAFPSAVKAACALVEVGA